MLSFCCVGICVSFFVSGVGIGCLGVGVLGVWRVPTQEQSTARISGEVSGLPSLHVLPGFAVQKGTPAQSMQLSKALSVGRRQTLH